MLGPQLPAVMAAGIGLRESKHCTEEAFKAIWGKGSDYILFECLDDKGAAQGCAVGKIETQYRCDSDGGFLKLQYILIQDPYYKHWVVEQDGSSFHHHVCRRSLSGCLRKVGRQELVHIQRWAFITAEEATACQKEWKVKRLDEVPSGVGRDERLVPMQLYSKSKPAKPVRRDASPVHSSGDESEDYDSLEEERSTSKDKKVKKEKHGKRKRRTVQDKSRRRKSEKEKKPDKERAGDKDGDGHPKSSPLDAMLDADEEPEYAKADNRFEELRKSLEERKRKREDEPAGAGASAVLAKRVQAGLERGKEKKKKKHKDSKKKMTKALKVLTGSRGDSGSESSGDFSEEDEDDTLLQGKAGDMLNRQRKLRRLSVEKPGTLLLRGFSLMHEQLGTLHGDLGGEGSAEDMLKPAALRYLLTSAFAQMNLQQVGEENLREMRTLASALDLLVGGKVSMAGDMMMQRLKSILMGLRDNSTAASRYLELIPMETYPTAATLAEADYARGLALRNARSEEMMSKVRGPG